MQGGGRMPPFDRLGERQRAAIVGFLFGNEPPPRRSGRRRPRRRPAPQKAEPPYAFGGFQRWFDREGYPAIKPPWGTLNAVDMNTGEILWKVPLGEYRGTHGARHPAHRHGELRRPGRHGRRARLHRRDRRRDVPRLRQEDGQGAVAGHTALQRQRHAEHVHGRRPPVRRHLRRRRQVEPARRRHHRRVRAAEVSVRCQPDGVRTCPPRSRRRSDGPAGQESDSPAQRHARQARVELHDLVERERRTS